MKRVVAILIFSGLLFNSTVFAQKARSIMKPPVSQSDFVVYGATEAFSDGGGVWLRWQAASETKNLGFNVYRAVGKTKEMVSDGMVGGAYLFGEETAFERTYSYFDPNGTTETVYYLESVGLDGRRQFSNPIFPQQISDLRSVANTTSEALKQARESAQSEIINNNLIIPKDLRATIDANRLPADIAMQRFVAGQPGVKIGVRKEGFYRVNFSELPVGFDTSLPDRLQLYLNGVEQGIIVVGGAGGYIEFYGQGMDVLESDTQTYYLIVGAQNGKRIASRIQRPFAGNVVANNFSLNHVKKYRKIYLSDPLNGDAENFYDNVPIASSPVSIPFDVPGIDFNSRKSLFTVAAQGITLGPHRIRIVLNGVEIGEIVGEDKTLMSKSVGILTSMLLPGANTLELTSLDGATDVNFLESISLNYARLYTAQNNQLSFYTNPYRTSTVSGFTSSNIRIFDLNYPDDPLIVDNLAVTQNGADFSVKLPAHRGYVMFGVENSAISQVATIAPNVPSTLVNDAHTGNLVIVTYKDWIAEANTWANYRRSPTGGNLSVEVVNIEDVYDEFSYGAQSTAGIRSFIQYVQANWQTQYVLFLGDASYDYRNYMGTGNPNFIPTKLVDTVYMETGADDALADYNDDGLAEVSVGRITARIPADVTQALNRTIAFETTVSQWQTRGAMFVSDMPIGYDFAALSERLRTQLPPTMPAVMRVRYDCIDPAPPVGQTYQECIDLQRANMLAEMNTGKYVVNYSGHGSTGFWAVSNTFFSSPHAAGLTNSDNNLSLWTMLTCLNGYFLNPSDSLAETLMKAPNGGAVAAWTSTGKTTPDMQEIMATRFYAQMTAGNMPRLGDLVKDAKTVVIGGRDVRLSWVLFGDPALKVR